VAIGRGGFVFALSDHVVQPPGLEKRPDSNRLPMPNPVSMSQIHPLPDSHRPAVEDGYGERYEPPQHNGVLMDKIRNLEERLGALSQRNDSSRAEPTADWPRFGQQ
jgi:hypothetical protein